MVGTPKITCKFRVQLVCGHSVRTRNPPLTDLVHYACTAGLGCGYNLMWVRYWHVDTPHIKDRNESYDGSVNHEGDIA